MDTAKPALPPANGFRPTNGQGRNGDGGLINVQPPRREDLQPAYAQTLQGESEDAGSHGWYGSMSMLSIDLGRYEILNAHSKYPRCLYRYSRSYPLLRRLPQSIQACQPRKRWSCYQVRPFLPRSRSRPRKDQSTVGEVNPGRRQDPDCG